MRSHKVAISNGSGQLQLPKPQIPAATNIFPVDCLLALTHQSHGLTAWLWLGLTSGQAKAFTKPSLWPGPAWLIWAWLGLARGLRPGHAHH
jgi:hypothetical protein